MNIGYLSLKTIRYIYRKCFLKESDGRNWKMFPVKDYANDMITDLLTLDAPCMVARLGSTELLCLVNYLGVTKPENYTCFLKYIRSQSPPWWWEPKTINQMQTCAGFFPKNMECIKQFCELMIKDMQQVDLLGSWIKDERYFDSELSQAKRVMLEDLEPFFATRPWTWALAGKKVVVVHPFAETIEKQYKRRDLIFENNLLPEFSLRTVQAVQSIGGESNGFSTWFDALEWMKKEIDKEDYDICILGCGAYGFPLAANVKRQGKKAIHLGGVTQLLFGIKGKRWENFIVYPYRNFYNDCWVRPGEKETPRDAAKVEGGCYW